MGQRQETEIGVFNYYVRYYNSDFNRNNIMFPDNTTPVIPRNGETVRLSGEDGQILSFKVEDVVFMAPVRDGGRAIYEIRVMLSSVAIAG
jgi:hypothetical protein